jgi:hypothetical protein
MLHKKIDTLRIGPAWEHHMLTLTGDKNDEYGQPLTEDVELWLRNPVDCVAELLGNPAFNGSIAYAPERVYTDSKASSRIYDEMWTADWWWDIQVRPTI